MIHRAGSHSTEETGYSASQTAPKLLLSLWAATDRIWKVQAPKIDVNVFYFTSYLQYCSPGSERLHCHLRVMSQTNGRVNEWRIIKHTDKCALEQDRPLFEP